MVTVGYYPYKRYSHDLRYQANAKYECFALFVQKMLQAVPTECAPYEKKIATKPKGEGSLQIKHRVVIVGPYTVNPLLSLPRGNLFQAHLRRGVGGLIEKRGLFERYQFSIKN